MGNFIIVLEIISSKCFLFGYPYPQGFWCNRQSPSFEPVLTVCGELDTSLVNTMAEDEQAKEKAGR